MKKFWNIFGAVLPCMFIILCLVGFLFAKNDPKHTDITNRFLAPCSKYLFGTDELGRCVFSRIMNGGFITLGIVITGAIIVVFFGTLIGIALGGYSKKKNIFWESLLNAVTAIPPIAYLIIFIGIWGNSVPTMLVALTASLILRMIKLVKTQAEIEYEKAYIMCGVASGASKMRIKFIHILPNIIRSIVQFICLSSAEMILSISGFSFIGLSLGDDVIDWGVMLSDARSVIGMRPDIILYPILFIFLSSLSFNYLGRLCGKERV